MVYTLASWKSLNSQADFLPIKKINTFYTYDLSRDILYFFDQYDP